MDRFWRARGALFAAALTTAMALTGCSTSKMTVGFMTPVLEQTVDAALRWDDPYLVVDALPTSILLIEGMLDTDPGNHELALLGSLVEFAYAFAHLETEAPDRASKLYARGLELAWRALDDRDAEHAIREGTFAEMHAAIAELDDDDMESVLWICSNWGLWIQLNLEDPQAAADLARLMPLAEHLADVDDTLFWGMPRILLGALHAGRPVILGGNPDRARQEFERAFAISDRNLLLAQVFYAKTLCVQTFDGEAYVSSLREVLDAPTGQLPEAEFLNQIARIQAESLLDDAEEIFE